MTFTCDAPGCRKGLVHLPSGFADPCPVCKGTGQLSFAEVCRLLDVDENTLRRFLRPDQRSRLSTCTRILNACLKITELIDVPIQNA